jgi:hypothetical protein
LGDPVSVLACSLYVDFGFGVLGHRFDSVCCGFESRLCDDTHGALKTGIPQALCGDNSAEIPMIFGVRPELARNNVLLFKPCRVS